MSASDFDRVLSTLGVDRDDARKLRKRFDRFGSVDYADFCRFVEADVDGLRFAASKIADKLAEQQRKGLDVLLPFQMADSGDHGIVPARDFQDALRALDLGDLQDADRRELVADRVEIKCYGAFVLNRRPPRHRRDACSMAWRCRFPTVRWSQRGRVIAAK